MCDILFASLSKWDLFSKERELLLDVKNLIKSRLQNGGKTKRQGTSLESVPICFKPTISYIKVFPDFVNLYINHSVTVKHLFSE